VGDRRVARPQTRQHRVISPIYATLRPPARRAAQAPGAHCRGETPESAHPGEVQAAPRAVEGVLELALEIGLHVSPIEGQSRSKGASAGKQSGDPNAFQHLRREAGGDSSAVSSLGRAEPTLHAGGECRFRSKGTDRDDLRVGTRTPIPERPMAYPSKCRTAVASSNRRLPTKRPRGRGRPTQPITWRTAPLLQTDGPLAFDRRLCSR
jgi:hypothetical protein